MQQACYFELSSFWGVYDAIFSCFASKYNDQFDWKWICVFFQLVWGRKASVLVVELVSMESLLHFSRYGASILYTRGCHAHVSFLYFPLHKSLHGAWMHLAFVVKKMGASYMTCRMGVQGEDVVTPAWALQSCGCCRAIRGWFIGFISYSELLHMRIAEGKGTSFLLLYA